jgi:2-oxoacid:acceptor oxidoreductase delta subunit (pyruvate/2-ketoisovalerate family)
MDPVFDPAWSPPGGGFFWVDNHPAGPPRDEPRSGRWLMDQLALGKGAALGLDLAAAGRPVHEIGRAGVGERGALSLEAYLGLREDRLWGEATSFEELNLAAFTPSRRSVPTGEGGLLTPGQALRSARRCFSCGLCNFCGRCEDFCPDLSIRIDPAARTREIDYDHCKGCGICAEECPRGAVGWVKEES